MLDLSIPPIWLTQANDPVAVRHRMLQWIAERVPYDGALFHALSPRVPLETGAFIGLDPAALDTERWDALAVELGRFRDVALQNQGVAADTDVIPPRGALRERYHRALRPIGLQHMAMVHLIVADQLRSVIVLGRRQHDPFQPRELDALRRAAPTLAVVDTLAQELAGTEQAIRRGTQCVDDRLTARQREIASLVAEGFTNPQIATALGLSPNTIRNRLADACRRLEVAGRAELVARASFR